VLQQARYTKTVLCIAVLHTKYKYAHDHSLADRQQDSGLKIKVSTLIFRSRWSSFSIRIFLSAEITSLSQQEPVVGAIVGLCMSMFMSMEMCVTNSTNLKSATDCADAAAAA
jgi:hypothetical protein